MRIKAESEHRLHHRMPIDYGISDGHLRFNPLPAREDYLGLGSTIPHAELLPRNF